MANRYIYSETLTTKETKKRYLESVIYPKIPLSDDDYYIITTASDRLDLLSNQYYGDPKFWWVIAVANNLNNASLYVDAGRQLRIPTDLTPILVELEKINR